MEARPSHRITASLYLCYLESAYVYYSVGFRLSLTGSVRGLTDGAVLAPRRRKAQARGLFLRFWIRF